MRKSVFFWGLLLCLSLQLFLPRYGSLEISLQPDKILFLSQYQVGSVALDTVERLDSQIRNEPDSNLVIPFHLGPYYGFHNRELELLSYDVQNKQVPWNQRILGQDFYLDFQNAPEYIIIRDFASRELGRFTGSSNAFVLKDAIYQFSDNGHSLHRYSRKGQLQWRIDMLSYVTGLDSNAGYTLISYVDGRAILLDQKGNIINEYINSGSRVNSIYGAAISKDIQNLALIAGLDQQRFLFLNKNQENYLFQYAKELPNQLRHSQWLRFSDYGPYVFYNNSEGISIYDFHYEKSRLYPAAGILSHVGEQEQSNIQFFLFRTPNGEGKLIGTHGTNGALLHLRLRGYNNYSLQIQGNKIYLGQDNLILSYQLEYL